jgi:Tol biopolymer transport system component
MSHIRTYRHTLLLAGFLAITLTACGGSNDPFQTRDGGSLAWSPDGEWIIFPSSNGYVTPELYALNIADALDGAGRGSWLHLSQGFDEVLGPANMDALTYMLLAWSPDGKRIAFASGDTIYAFDAACLDAPDTCVDSLAPLIGGATVWVSLAWSPSGDRLLVESAISGPLVKTEKGLMADKLVRVISIVMADGSQEVLYTRQTEPRQAPDWKESPLFAPRWSPDGDQIIFVSDTAGSPDLYLMGLDGGDPVQITGTSEEEFNPAWSPDGSQIAYWMTLDGKKDIYRQPLDGGKPVCVTCDYRPSWEYSALNGPLWSPDGARIAYMISGQRVLFRKALPFYVYVISADGSQRVTIMEHDLPWQMAWSPDGSQLAFSFRPTLDINSMESDIYLIDADGSNLTNLTPD